MLMFILLVVEWNILLTKQWGKGIGWPLPS